MIKKRHTPRSHGRTGGASNKSEAAESPATIDESLGPLPDVLTVEQVAAYLHVSRAVVYGEINRGKLPAVRIGERVLRVSRYALERWMRGDT